MPQDMDENSNSLTSQEGGCFLSVGENTLNLKPTLKQEKAGYRLPAPEFCLLFLTSCKVYMEPVM